MVQELIDLKKSILEERYEDALTIIDELDGMSKQAILRNIESFLVRLVIHLIKNQVEQRLTNSWAASISDSIIQIKKLNLKDNQKSYYFQKNEWQLLLEEAIEAAINPASVEVMQGELTPLQLSEMIDSNQIISTAQSLLHLTYAYGKKDLPKIINSQLSELPGGENWLFSRR